MLEPMATSSHVRHVAIKMTARVSWFRVLNVKVHGTLGRAGSVSKSALSYEFDQQVCHGHWLFKTVVNLTVAVILICTWLLGLTAARSCSMFFRAKKHTSEIENFGSVLRFGQYDTHRHGNCTIYQAAVYVKIKNIYTCSGRKRIHNELSRFDNLVFCFRKSRLSWFAFSVLIIYTEITLFSFWLPSTYCHPNGRIGVH